MGVSLVHSEVHQSAEDVEEEPPPGPGDPVRSDAQCES